MSIETLLPWIQIVLSVVLTALILLQNRGEAGLGGAFGGGGGGEHFSKRRGLERILFHTTIVTAILFGLTSILWLLI